jgi:hypothetical protein
MDEKIPRDSEIKMLKNRLVDMNDKFDLLLYTMITQGKVRFSSKKQDGSL